MNPLKNNTQLLSKVISGDIDLFFDKSGKDIKFINDNPNEWQLHAEKSNCIVNTVTNLDSTLIPLYKPENSYNWSNGMLFIDIVSATLIRLEDITEEDALRTGVEKIENGFKHYCPQKLFPTSVLKKQKAGFPYLNNARASYFTNWIDNYGVLDVALNPWIWRYEIKFNLEKSIP